MKLWKPGVIISLLWLVIPTATMGRIVLPLGCLLAQEGIPIPAILAAGARLVPLAVLLHEWARKAACRLLGLPADFVPCAGQKEDPAPSDYLRRIRKWIDRLPCAVAISGPVPWPAWGSGWRCGAFSSPPGGAGGSPWE